MPKISHSRWFFMIEVSLRRATAPGMAYRAHRERDNRGCKGIRLHHKAFKEENLTVFCCNGYNGVSAAVRWGGKNRWSRMPRRSMKMACCGRYPPCGTWLGDSGCS